MKKPAPQLLDYYQKLVEIHGLEKVLNHLDEIISRQEGEAKIYYQDLKSKLFPNEPHQ